MVNFNLHSIFKSTFCKQTVQNLIRRPILRRLIWVFFTVYLCPIKRMLGLNVLITMNHAFYQSISLTALYTTILCTYHIIGYTIPSQALLHVRHISPSHIMPGYASPDQTLLSHHSSNHETTALRLCRNCNSVKGLCTISH